MVAIFRLFVFVLFFYNFGLREPFFALKYTIIKISKFTYFKISLSVLKPFVKRELIRAYERLKSTGHDQ